MAVGPKIFLNEAHADVITKALFYYMNSLHSNSLQLSALRQTWKLWTEAQQSKRFVVEVETDRLTGGGDLIIKR